MRSCKKNTSPSPVNLSVMTIGTIRGESNNNAIPENKTSKKRSTITSSDRDIYQSLYDQTLVRKQNIV